MINDTSLAIHAQKYMLNKTCLIEALVGAGRGDPVSGSFDLMLVKIIAKINAKNAPLLLSKLPEDHDNSD